MSNNGVDACREFLGSDRGILDEEDLLKKGQIAGQLYVALLGIEEAFPSTKKCLSFANFKERANFLMKHEDFEWKELEDLYKEIIKYLEAISPAEESPGLRVVSADEPVPPKGYLPPTLEAFVEEIEDEYDDPESFIREEKQVVAACISMLMRETNSGIEHFFEKDPLFKDFFIATLIDILAEVTKSTYYSELPELRGLFSPILLGMVKLPDCELERIILNKVNNGPAKIGFANALLVFRKKVHASQNSGRPLIELDPSGRERLKKEDPDELNFVDAINACAASSALRFDLRCRLLPASVPE